jgi:acetylornithine deacetylase
MNEDLVLDTTEFLKGLIRIPSLSGKEEEAIAYIHDRFKPLCDDVALVPLSDALKKDPDYASPVPDISYDGRYNLRAVVRGSGEGSSLLFNTHTDVVPPSAMQQNAFDPVLEEGALFGRGACDAKGQIAALYMLMKKIKSDGLTFKGDMIFHIVVEEENGGNGTLAAIRRGEKADAAIVLEPTNLTIFPSVRGAVWFRVSCTGKPGHSGSGGKRISALDLAVEAMGIMRKYHDDLLTESKWIPLFDHYADPMPITFGRLIAGDWPATIPNKAVLEGVLGFLSNRTRFEVMEELEKSLQSHGSAELKENVDIEFIYRHDTHVLEVDHPLVTGLKRASELRGVYKKISAMAASCDSWFYHNQLKIPTVVFGPGDLGVAHSNREHIKIDDLRKGAEILLSFAGMWCGINK